MFALPKYLYHDSDDGGDDIDADDGGGDKLKWDILDH